MGRLQHLERLALGRSAYQPGAASSNQDQLGSEGLQTTDRNSVESSHSFTLANQHYDFKGRPVNLESNAQRARLRYASNEILALVGVVERKERTDAVLHQKINNERAVRQRLHIREDNRGNEWSAFLDVVSWFALWWPTSLVRRIQIGLYSTDLPFAQILQTEAKTMFANGWQGVLLGLLPGTGISILHKVLWQVLALITEESIGAIQNRIVVSNMRRRKARILIRSLTVFVDIVLVAIDMLLLPLETYALARQLNVAPPVSWRPLLTTQLPSFFRIAYTTTFSSPASLLTSVAPFLIGYSFLTRDPSPEAPAFSDLTSHRLPSISEHPDSDLQTSPSALRDPFGAILHQTWLLRQRFLQSVGWDVHEEHHPGATNGWETDISYLVRDSARGLQMKIITHRSTSLARLPAMWLGLRVDMFLLRILLLPFDSMVMRKVLQSYLTSGMPLTKAASNAGVGAGRPGIWGMLAGEAVTNSWTSVAGRLSQLGLSMALNLGVEAVFFGLVYGFIRRQGIGSYGWGHYGDQEEDKGLEDAIDF
jgi:hypothetical protein